MSVTHDTSRLCLACGFCCNGVLFRDVELQAADAVEQLEASGVAVQAQRRKLRVAQPCAALCADQRCRVYELRPAHCRQFECALLQSVIAGRLEPDRALQRIGVLRRQKDRLERLLGRLGENRPDLPLLARFQRTTRRLERRGPENAGEAQAFVQLTSAFHRFQLALRRHLIPRH